jgi:conjugation system TraG family ATPase
VVTLIIMELFTEKMRKLKGVRKFIVIEEAWKAVAQEGMDEYIKYLFKTVRKFYGYAAVVTQEVEDIVSSAVIRHAIVNNSDVKVLLDQGKHINKFDEIQALLGLTDKQRAEILSINRGHEPGRLYKDVWIGLGPSHSKVYRLEVSEEEYYTYTSEQQEKVLVHQYIERYGDVPTAISRLAADRRAKKEGV